jgi:hypothetical protein
MNPVAFIDDDPTKLHRWIVGVPVRGAFDRFEETLRRYSVDEVVLSSPAINGKVELRIREICTEAAVEGYDACIWRFGELPNVDVGSWALTRALRVGFDGRAFVSPAAGIRRYVANVATALLSLDEQIDVVALGGPGPEALPPGVGFCAEPAHPPTNLGWTLVGLPRAAARAGVALIHAPAYTAPFWSGVPVV